MWRTLIRGACESLANTLWQWPVGGTAPVQTASETCSFERINAAEANPATESLLRSDSRDFLIRNEIVCCGIASSTLISC
jgi:hypothetical protein